MMKNRIGKRTEVKNRVYLCRILEKIRANEEYAKSVGIEDNTWFKEKTNPKTKEEKS